MPLINVSTAWLEETRAFVTANPPAEPATGRKLYFGYFGDAAGNAAAWGDHCNIAFVPEWGEAGNNYQVVMDRNISFMKEAAAAGVKSVVYDVGFQLWGPSANNPLKTTAPADLAQVFNDLKATGVLGMVKALYPIDEPDLTGKSDAQLVAAVTVLRTAAAAFPELAGVRVWTFYAQNGLPGLSAFDDVGSDHYGDTSRALAWYAQLPPNKGKLLIPGGAQPWRDDPAPFVQYALANPSVTAIIAFLYVDYSAGQGIGSNGMLPAYRTAGKTIIAQT